MDAPVGSNLTFGPRWIWLLLGSAAVLLALAVAADASHFRGGSISALPTGNGNEVKVQGLLYYRWTYFNPPPLKVGDPFTTWDPFSFSDTAGSTSWTGKVVSISYTEDWFGVKVGATGDGFLHTFPSESDNGSPWIVKYASGNRIGTSAGQTDNHVNNPNTSYSLVASVSIPNQPPLGNLPPIWYCRQNAVCWIPVNTADAEKDEVRVVWGTDCETTNCGGTFYQPGPCPSCGTVAAAEILKNNTIRWDTTGATAYGDPNLPGVIRTFYSFSIEMDDSHDGRTPQEVLISLNPPRAPPPPPAPGASFDWQAYACGVPKNVKFHDTSSGAAGATLVSSNWTWGDGGAAPYMPWQAYVNHTYALAGTYSVTLQVTDSNGQKAYATHDLTVVACPPPTAAFSMDPYHCAVPRTITFRDESIATPGHPIVRSQWNFGDGSPVADNSPAPASIKHSYTMPSGGGLITVKLRVMDNATTWSSWVGHKLSMCPVPSFHAVYDPNGCPDYAIHFNDHSTDPDGEVRYWTWDFGDDHGSTDRNPVHAYIVAGRYLVTLNVTDNNGDSATASLLVDGHGYHDCDVDAGNPGAKNPGDGAAHDNADASQSEQDADRDGFSAKRDNCDSAVNPNQADADKDGIGDACDGDKDGDQVLNIQDNCPLAANPKQEDADLDGVGDKCQGDADGDLIIDSLDDCPTESDPLQADLDHDGKGDVCDLDIDGDGVSNAVDLYPLDGARTLLRDDKQYAPLRTSANANVADAGAASKLPWIFGGLAVAAVAALLLVVARRRNDKA